VRAALLKRAGLRRTVPLFLEARLTAAVGRNRQREQCLPAVMAVDEGMWSVRFAGWHGSGDLTCLNTVNALVFVPRGEAELPAGARVRVTPIDGGRCGDISFGVA
jgi:molybdopterin biosynthesis enzyme